MPQQEGLRSAICRSSFRQRAVGLMSGAWIWLLPSAYRLKISRAFIKCGSSKDFSDFLLPIIEDALHVALDQKCMCGAAEKSKRQRVTNVVGYACSAIVG